MAVSHWGQLLLNMPGVSEVFTYRRYKQITKYLHYYAHNTEPLQNDPTRDRAFKIRNLVNNMKDLFIKYYECDEDVVIDECVVPFRRGLGNKMYFKDKPVKWGVKLWMIFDSAITLTFIAVKTWILRIWKRPALLLRLL